MDFETLYAQQFLVVYRYLLAICGNSTLAEDLTQETFYRAIVHSDSFRGECKLSVWLCQIGKNCWLSYLRHEKHCVTDEKLEEIADAQDFEERFLDSENAKQLHKQLHTLSEPYREVFSLRIFAELPFSQIGELFGKSENWARVTYHRAKLKLKEDLS